MKWMFLQIKNASFHFDKTGLLWANELIWFSSNTSKRSNAQTNTLQKGFNRLPQHSPTFNLSNVSWQPAITYKNTLQITLLPMPVRENTHDFC